MTTPIHLGSTIEVYITNECNLTCSNCNRFNNYNFSGHYSYKKNQQDILAWSKKITASLITIIGGEPLLHPDIYQWAELVTTAWPDRPVMIQTNGTINHPLIDKMKQTLPNISFCASLHQSGMTKLLAKNKFKNIIDNTEFADSALIDCGNYFEVYKSDPAQAFESCTMRHSHTIFEGKLYKCPMVAVLPEFSKQYRVNFTQEQYKLLYDYRALDIDCSLAQLEQFVNSSNCHIEQCSLCPEQYRARTITFDPTSKKRSKIIAIHTQ